MKYSIILILLFTISLSAYSLGPGTVKGGYHRCTVFNTRYEGKKSERTLDWVYHYDENGKMCEELANEGDSLKRRWIRIKNNRAKTSEFIDYNFSGQLSSREITRYDDENRFVTSTEYSAGGIVWNSTCNYYTANGRDSVTIDYSPEGKITGIVRVLSDNKGNETVYMEYDGDGFLKYLWMCVFDSKGRKKYTVSYDEINRSQEICAWYYEYNDKDSIVVEKSYSNNRLVSELIYKYDGNNKLSEIVRRNPDGSVRKVSSHKYNEFGYVTEQVEYEHSGKVKSKRSSVYDRNGDTVKIVLCVYSGRCEHCDVGKETITYGKKNRIRELLWESIDGKFREKYVYRYDKNGNLTGEWAYDTEGFCLTRYKYDRYGNIIERSDYTNGKPSFKSEYKFE